MYPLPTPKTRHPETRRRFRPGLEQLEDRLTPSWSSVPPAWIPPPANALPVTLNSQGDAGGPGYNYYGENDFVRFTARTSGTYVFQATTPYYSNMDTVIGVFDAAGYRLGYNDDIAWPYLTDSRVALTLQAGRTYYFGITRYIDSDGGAFNWSINGPSDGTSGGGGGGGGSSGGFQIQVRFGSGLTAAQQNVFRQAAARWQRIIIGDLPNATYRGQVVDDVLIDASGPSIDGPGQILGQAGPDAFRPGSSLPIHGVMEFDRDDLASLERQGQLVDVIVHEMGHVLGVGTIWSRRGLLRGAGTSNPRFVGPRATAEYNRIFRRSETGVPVENQGGPGTRDGHWRENILGTELMTGYLNQGVRNPLSRITAASMADLGYQVNMNAADTYTPGASLTSVSRGGTRVGRLLVAGEAVVHLSAADLMLASTKPGRRLSSWLR
jgi:hypothetical protein